MDRPGDTFGDTTPGAPRVNGRARSQLAELLGKSAGGGDRTHTGLVSPQDFKSCASASFATPASIESTTYEAHRTFCPFSCPRAPPIPRPGFARTLSIDLSNIEQTQLRSGCHQQAEGGEPRPPATKLCKKRRSAAKAGRCPPRQAQKRAGAPQRPGRTTWRPMRRSKPGEVLLERADLHREHAIHRLQRDRSPPAHVLHRDRRVQRAYRCGRVTWDARVSTWIERPCRIANRDLSETEWNRYLPGEPFERGARDDT